MDYPLAFLLLIFSVLGGTSADDPLERVQAFVGLTVNLPCRQIIVKNTEVPAIEWSKLGLSPDPYVFLYREDHREDYGLKHKDFEFRTNLFMTDLHHGNFSMRLSEVRKTDAGMYLCKTIWNNGKHDVKRVQLDVDTIPTPKLSVVSRDEGAVNLSCEVHTCFTTAPRLTFWDGDGNPLKANAVEPVNDDESGCHGLKQQVIVSTTAKSVVCRAEFTEISQSRDAHILIPEGTKESCTVPMVRVGIVAVLMVLVLVGVGFLIYKVCSKSGEKKKGIVKQSSVETSASSGSETKPFLTHDSVEIEIDGPPPTTEPPNPISSTSNAADSQEDSRDAGVIVHIPDVTDADAVDREPATCEINKAAKSVKFLNEEDKRKPLTRQDAHTDTNILPQNGLSNSILSLPNGIGKPPAKKRTVTRSRSVSDSCFVAMDDPKNLRPRLSLSLSKIDTEKIQLIKLDEEPEQDALLSKMGRQE